MSYSISRCKSNKIYKLKTYNSIVLSSNKNNSNEKELNHLKNYNCIINLGNNNNDLIDLINSKLFNYLYYKNLYLPKEYMLPNGTIKKFTSREKEYKLINKNIESNMLYKKNISDYNHRNIYIDYCKQLSYLFNSEMIKNSNKDIKVNKFIMYMKSIVNSINKTYKNLLFYVPVINNNEKDFNTINTLELIFKYPKYRELFLDYFIKETELEEIYILYHNKSLNFTFSFNLLQNDLDFKKIRLMIKKLINLNSNSDEINSLVDVNDVENKEDSVIDKNQDVVNNSMNSIKNSLDLNQKKNLSQKETELLNKMQDKIENTIVQSDDNEEYDEDSIFNKLSQDEEFLKELEELKDIQKNGTNTSKEQEKINKLKEEQNKVKVDLSKFSGNPNQSNNIEKILNDYKETSLERHEVGSDRKDIHNEEVKHSKIIDFDKTYMNKQFSKDILSAFTSFNNDPDIQFFIVDIQSEDTSDDMNQKETLTVKMKDTLGKVHVVKVDIPIVKDNAYMYLNGTRKIIQKQIIAKPVMKTKNNEVQLSSNYNKTFIRRFGQKLSSNLVVLEKFFNTENLQDYFNDNSVKFTLGNVEYANRDFMLNIFYVYFSSFLWKIETDECIINFDYQNFYDTIINNSSNRINKKLNEFYNSVVGLIPELGTKYHIIGYAKDYSYFLIVPSNSNEVYKFGFEEITSKNPSLKLISKSLLMYITKNYIKENLNDDGKKYLNSITRPKSLMFNRIALNGKETPLIVILGYEYGLTTVLERYGIEYVFSNSNKKSDLLVEDVNKIRFKNGYLYYDNTKVRNSLLLSGLNVISTDEYDFLEFNKTGTPYLDFFSDSFGSRNTGKGIHNSLALFLDNKTIEVLRTLKLPDNIFDLLLYANTLLETNYFDDPGYKGNFRLRGAEQISSILYKVLADSVRTYKDTSKSGNAIKVSVPQDIVIKKLLESQSVSEAPRLNPSLDIDNKNIVTYKGPSGINLDDGFTSTYRTFNDSMKGLFGYATPNSNKAGVTRSLSYDPAILNTLGFLDPDSENKNENTSMFSITELLNPFTPVNADPPRKLRFI